MQPVALLVQSLDLPECTEETFYAENVANGDVRARTQEGQCRFLSVRATSFNLSMSACVRTSWPVARLRFFAFGAVMTTTLRRGLVSGLASPHSGTGPRASSHFASVPG